ncbi:MAG: DUF1844 domain-containing protein [Phycisphaerales bacterium]|jgi:hypothetical protein|nr:DUF1844 domain-containing protein [Phycisphaerales bacterium]
MSTDETPKIHVDTDWKAEAQAERDRLAEAEDKHSAKQEASKGLPPADFKGLVGVLASQAIMGLGAVPDQSGKGVMIDLEGAKFAIDLLAVLEEKSKGNLEDEEATELSTVLSELRARFVQITQLLAEQMQKTPATEGGGAPGIITPE